MENEDIGVTVQKRKELISMLDMSVNMHPMINVSLAVRHLLVYPFAPMVNVMKSIIPMMVKIQRKCFSFYLDTLLLRDCTDVLNLVFVFFMKFVLASCRHVGCECNQGFEGEHCEYIEGQSPTKKSKAGLIVGLVFLFIGITTISGLFIVRGLRKRRTPRDVEMANAPGGNGGNEVKVHEVDAEIS